MIATEISRSCSCFMANQQLPLAGKHTGFMLSWLCSFLCTKWFKRQCQPAQVTDLAHLPASNL
jgi:hypothetical protein